jgi:DNA-binding phage protein
MILRVLDFDQFKAEFNKFTKEYKKQLESDTPEALPLMVIRDKLKIYSEHPFVEGDTGISAKWFKSVFDVIDKVTEELHKVQISKEIKDEKGIQAYTKECKKSYASLVTLAKKPVKARKGEVKSIRKKAYIVREELQKKHDRDSELKEKKKKHKKKKKRRKIR